MALSIEQLLSPVDENEALEQVLDILTSLGFSARSWQSGSMARTIAQLIARLRSDSSQLTVRLARLFLNDFSTEDGLTLFSDSHYDNQRTEAVRTEGDIEMITDAGAGPYALAIGEMRISDDDGNTYTNKTALLLTPGSTITDTFQAEVAGAKANVPINTVDTLVTGLAGVTVNNPDNGSGDWITQAGADEESDTELQTRNRNKWTTLTATPPAEFYELKTLEAEPSITRVFVDDTNARGAGKVDIYIADDSGGITSPAILAAVQDEVEAAAALTATVELFAAIDKAIDVEVDLIYDPTIFVDAAAAEDAVTAQINAHFAATDIGGVRPDGFSLGLLYREILEVTGIVNAGINDPTDDVPLATNEVPIPGTISPSATPVT